jgi:hypothetical protein
LHDNFKFVSTVIQTPQHETPLHIALRLGHVAAVKLVLEAANFDVVKCDSLHARMVQLFSDSKLLALPVLTAHQFNRL